MILFFFIVVSCNEKVDKTDKYIIDRFEKQFENLTCSLFYPLGGVSGSVPKKPGILNFELREAGRTNSCQANLEEKNEKQKI